MFNPKQDRWGIWISEYQSREISKGLNRSEMLYDLGTILSQHLETCESQLKQDKEIFNSYDEEVANWIQIDYNNTAIISNQQQEIELLTQQFKSQRRQKWLVVVIAGIATYFAIF